MFNMRGKVIAITGGGAGIGYATATLLVSQGAKVAISDVNDTALQAAQKELEKVCADGGEILATQVDVRKREQVDGWVDEVVKKWGKLDGAANLAGVIPKSINVERVEDLNDPDWNFVLDVSLHSLLGFSVRVEFCVADRWCRSTSQALCSVCAHRFDR